MEASFASLKLASVYEVATAPECGPSGEVERDASQAEFADVEIAAELNLTRRSADWLMGFAWQVRERHPQVWRLLNAGHQRCRSCRPGRLLIDHRSDPSPDPETLHGGRLRGRKETV